MTKFMCEDKWNRTDQLCGSCKDGHAPLAFSYDMRCVECPEGNKNIWKYILVAYGPLTLFYFIVLFFKINATTSHLHGYLYFSQAVSVPALIRVSLVQFEPGSTFHQLYIALMSFYSIWNLDILRGLYPEICLDVKTGTILALDYGLALYPLLLTVISYIVIELHGRNCRVVVVLCTPFQRICRGFRRNWNVRTTVIDAFATFFLLSFVKVHNTTIDLLTPVYAHDVGSGNKTWLWYYVGNTGYFSRGHVPYAILAIIVGVMLGLLPSLMCIFYPFRWFQTVLSALRLQNRILQTLMDSFQGCFKDGTSELGKPKTRDYRWFSAIPLIMRLLAFSVASFALDSSYFPWATTITVITLLLTIILQPYKSNLAVYTKIDAFFLGMLAIVLAMTDGVNLAGYIHQSLLEVNHILLAIFASTPLFYMVCVCLYWIISRLKKGTTLLSYLKARWRGYANIQNSYEDEELPDRLEHPEHYKRVDLENPVSNGLGVANEAEDTSHNDTY